MFKEPSHFKTSSFIIEQTLKSVKQEQYLELILK